MDDLALGHVELNPWRTCEQPVTKPKAIHWNTMLSGFRRGKLAAVGYDKSASKCGATVVCPATFRDNHRRIANFL